MPGFQINPLSKRKRKKNVHFDRFIPARLNEREKEFASYMLKHPERQELTPHLRRLNQIFFGREDINSRCRILPIIPSLRLPVVEEKHLRLPVVEKKHQSIKYQIRSVRVMDAYNVIDDFYTSNLSLSNMTLAAGLDDCVYVSNMQTNATRPILDLNDHDRINAIKIDRGNMLVVSTEKGSLSYLDIAANRRLRKLQAVNGKDAISIEMTDDPARFFIGTRDGFANLIDCRMANPTVLQTRNRNIGETADMVCGLSYQSRTNLLACGMNNNRVLVWDIRKIHNPMQRMGAHKSAIKALQFHPNQAGLLASGGGVNDKTIRLWNAQTANEYASVKVGGQVSSIMWSVAHPNCLLSTDERNLSLFSYSREKRILVKEASDNQNQQRILTAAQSPDGEKITTLGADETLRFFSTSSNQKKRCQSFPDGLSYANNSCMQIR